MRTRLGRGWPRWQRPVPALISGIGLSLGLFVIFRYGLGLGLQPLPEMLG